MVIHIPKEYEEIKAGLKKAHPDWAEEKLAEMAARTFASVFGTNPQHAEQLEKEGMWEKYKKSHSKGGIHGKELGDVFEAFAVGMELKEEEDGDYIDGFVSSPELDLGDDLVANQREIVDQLNTPNSLANKLSYRHDWMKTKERDVIPPLGIVVKSELRQHPVIGKEAAWARFKLNKEYEFNGTTYDKIKRQIKEGFLDGFSIEFKALNTVDRFIGNVKARVINSLRIIGIGLAARPMNPHSIFTGVMVKEYDYVGDSTDDTESKEVWTAAFVNDLPDSSFAYISPGGEKDEEGKTKPRSLRHLPYKNKNGEPDPAHVRNALARLPQTDIPVSAKAEARRKLVAAARKVGVEVSEKDGKEVDVMETDAKSLEAKEAEIAALNEKVAALEKKEADLSKLVQTKEAFEAKLKDIEAKEKVLIQQRDAESKEQREKLDAEFKEYKAKAGTGELGKGVWAKAGKLIKENQLW